MCDSEVFKRVTDRYEQVYKYVDYNNLTVLQQRLLMEISGIWYNLHNVYYNIPVCKHPVGVDSLTKFINYLIITEPEKVRDFWLHATFMEVLNELITNASRYFAYIFLNDQDGFVFTGKSADIVNVPDDFEEINIDPVLRNHLRVLGNTPGRVTTWAEFKQLNNLQDAIRRVRKSTRRPSRRRLY